MLMFVNEGGLPLKINQAGVIPAIFASALLLLPVTFSNFSFSDNDTFLNLSSYFTQGQPLYMLLYASGIIFFTFFYTSITFNPTETADNLRKYGGFVPGIRPGENTALYIDKIVTKLTTIGALYLTLVCLMPEFLIANYPIPFYLGGTSPCAGRGGRRDGTQRAAPRGRAAARGRRAAPTSTRCAGR